jgi:hypothetical protein
MFIPGQRSDLEIVEHGNKTAGATLLEEIGFNDAVGRLAVRRRRESAKPTDGNSLFAAGQTSPARYKLPQLHSPSGGASTCRVTPGESRELDYVYR